MAVWKESYAVDQRADMKEHMSAALMELLKESLLVD